MTLDNFDRSQQMLADNFMVPFSEGWAQCALAYAVLALCERLDGFSGLVVDDAGEAE